MLINNSLSAKNIRKYEREDYMFIIFALVYLIYFIFMVIKIVHNRKTYDKCNLITDVSLLILTFAMEVVLPLLSKQFTL